MPKADKTGIRVVTAGIKTEKISKIIEMIIGKIGTTAEMIIEMTIKKISETRKIKRIRKIENRMETVRF